MSNIIDDSVIAALQEAGLVETRAEKNGRTDLNGPESVEKPEKFWADDVTSVGSVPLGGVKPQSLDEIINKF